MATGAKKRIGANAALTIPEVAAAFKALHDIVASSQPEAVYSEACENLINIARKHGTHMEAATTLVMHACLGGIDDRTGPPPTPIPIPADIRARTKELAGRGEGAIAEAMAEERSAAFREARSVLAEWADGLERQQPETAKLLDRVAQAITAAERKMFSGGEWDF